MARAARTPRASTPLTRTHRTRTRRPAAGAAAAAAAAALLLAGPLPSQAAPPSDVPEVAPATPGTLQDCETLTGFEHGTTVIHEAHLVEDGELTHAGAPVGAHCLVSGEMQERISDVDGERYAIGFEMRLPTDWSGRFLHQANGGMDGEVAPALGTFTGGQLENGLQQGFAVLSSDAGHASHQNPLFGLDPQARLDYGYQAVGTLTPMAEGLIEEAYGRGPDTSYMAGGSNGGRHTMVAASRYAEDYDGFFALAPGFNLPQASVAQLWGAQQWHTIADDGADLSSALTVQEREVVAEAVLERCDGIDGLRDGIVADGERCQKFFDVQRDVPECEEERDGTCLTGEQKRVLEEVFAGATTTEGEPIYASFPFDPGVTNGDWGWWTFDASVALDPMAVGFVFSSEPEDPSILADLPGYALDVDVDEKAADIWEPGIAGESAMEFMTPPNPAQLDGVRDTGAKMLVAHGAADAVFSADDTAHWYEEVQGNHRDAEDFVRYFPVPGMGHVAGGAATDQFDALGALVAWVEHGEAPDSLEAAARGAGNPGGANDELPEDWAADRTRLLCPYPEVARYHQGDPEDAESFRCRPSAGGPGSGR